MTKIAIICANGMGDLILMSLLAYNAQIHHEVFVFHPHGERYRSLFPQFNLLHSSSYHTKDFDLTLVQNDHGELCCELQSNRGKDKSIIFLFPKPSRFYREGDFIFDRTLAFAENIKLISKKLFGSFFSEMENPFENHVKKNHQRVLIHPMSQNPTKTWPLKNFKKLYHNLIEEGFDPHFVMTDEEKKSIPMDGYSILTTPTVSDLALEIAQSGYFIGCDSGPGHLASYLKTPTLTLSFDASNTQLWKPSFFINYTVTPFFRFNFIRSRKLAFLNHFIRHLISVKKVKNKFLELVRGASV